MITRTTSSGRLYTGAAFSAALLNTPVQAKSYWVS